jgi:glycosyltransferase involved in cell wall biosynthesis
VKKISIITPCFNEELNVETCYLALKKIMKAKLPNYSYEHIFADNASNDSTFLVLQKIAKKDKNVKIILNSRNVGPFRNMWNAMKNATGDAIVPLLPADLQDPAEIIPSFVKNWERGDLVVYGVRSNRQEIWMMKLLRSIYYKIICKFADAVIPLNSGEFLLADRLVIKSILAVDDQYPYIRGLIAQTAVKSSSINYTWVKRKKGKSKNSFIDLIDQAINGFVSTSRVPARIALLFGFIFSIIGFIGAAITFILFLLNKESVASGIPTIIVAIFLFGGIQLLFFGIIGEYILSIHGQVRKSPPMFEIKRINFKKEFRNE